MELEIYAPAGPKFWKSWALTEELPLRRNLDLALTYAAERAPTTCTPCRANHLLERAQSLRHPETKCDKKGAEHTLPTSPSGLKKKVGQNIFWV